MLRIIYVSTYIFQKIKFQESYSSLSILSILCLSVLTTYFLESSGNVWEKVSTIPDVVHPDFGAVEDLFSQKTFVHSGSDGQPAKKKTEIVRFATNYQ